MEVSSFIKNLKPYVPGKSIEEVQREYGLKEIIKLASNENPLGPSEGILKAIHGSLSQIHLYPESSYFNAKKTISEYYKLQPNQLVIGNGSNELIDLIIRIFCEPNQDKVLTAAQSFVAYKVCSHVNRCEITEVPLKKDFGIDVQKMADCLTAEHKVVFIPNPNNPTGKFITASELAPLIQKIKSRDDVLLVLDEAYTEFVRGDDAPDSLELFREIKNLVILKTFAKVYGMAGLRVGFMIAHPHVTELVEKVRLPFNVSIPSAAAIPAALADREYLKLSQKIVWEGLDYFYKELSQMGLDFCTSQGNFIFFDTKIDSSVVFEEMLKKGIIVRPVKNYGFPTHIRLSVGTKAENEKAISALKAVLKNSDALTSRSF